MLCLILWHIYDLDTVMFDELLLGCFSTRVFELEGSILLLALDSLPTLGKILPIDDPRWHITGQFDLEVLKGKLILILRLDSFSGHFLDVILGHRAYLFLSEQLLTLLALLQTNVAFTWGTWLNKFSRNDVLNLKRLLGMFDLNADIFQDRSGKLVLYFVFDDKVLIEEKDSHPGLELRVWVCDVDRLVYLSQGAIV